MPQSQKNKTVDLDLLFQTFNDGFAKVDQRLMALEAKATGNEFFQENQVAHYKLRLRNQEEIKNDLKELKDALIETPLNDGGVVNKVRNHAIKIENVEKSVNKHITYFYLIGATLVVLIPLLWAAITNHK